MKKVIIFFIILFSLLITLSVYSEQRPEKWAAPIVLQGVPNLHKINEDVYRSAQPTKEGFKEIKKLGVKTVINLSFFHSDRSLVKGAELNVINIYMIPFTPQEEDIVTFLKVISDKKSAPFLIHCQHGADRTGLISAVYRIVFEGWTKDEAINEMTNGGYGCDFAFNLSAFIKELDIEKLKKQAGI
jgi:protein tyrosine/serine phosphatase